MSDIRTVNAHGALTPQEHELQRQRVAGSLAVDDARETNRTVYPARRSETVPGAALVAAVAWVAQQESMRSAHRVREHGAWS